MECQPAMAFPSNNDCHPAESAALIPAQNPAQPASSKTARDSRFHPKTVTKCFIGFELKVFYTNPFSTKQARPEPAIAEKSPT
jgi:hypothetical protein